MNIILKLGIWDGSQYATPPQSDDFVIRFSNKPNDTLSYGSSTSHISATPNFGSNVKVEAASKLWSLKTKLKETVLNNRKILVNSSHASPPNDYAIDQNTMINNIVYPQGATPGYIHIKNTKPQDVTAIGYGIGSSPFVGYGGTFYSTDLKTNVFVPSSPNIVFNTYSDSATVTQYFSEISYPYSSTPSSLSVGLKTGNNYEENLIDWIPFTLASTPITGYVDEHGYVGYNNISGEFVPSKNKDIIIVPEITRETFGVSGSSKFEYFFENITIQDPEDVNVLIWSEQKIVNPFLNKNYVLKPNNITSLLENSLYTTKAIKYPSNSIIEKYDLERNTTVFSNFIAKGRLYDASMETRINTGWLHLDKEEYYVYSNPKKERFTGRLKEINTSQVAQAGAPIYVSATKEDESTPYIEYIETAFEDAATPRSFSFYNTETLKPSYDDSFYLSYYGVDDLSIVDSVTGLTVYTNLEFDDNIVSLQSSTPIFNQNRDYYIKYKVKNSYYVDNILSGSSYYSKIVFDSTPNIPLVYDVVYETSIYEHSTPVQIVFGETDSLLEKGYVIVSAREYPFAKAEVKISPYNIMDDGKDYITISILSLDVNGNPKPNQEFSISSSSLNIIPSNVMTDSNGFATARAKYSLPTRITKTTKDSIRITGLGSENSSFDKQYSYSIYSSYTQSHSIVAAVDPSTVKADGVSSIFVDGIISKNNLPEKDTIIYWRKGRTPYYAVEKEEYSSSPAFSGNSGIVKSDLNGRFTIGPIVSQDRANPGYWYMVVESDFKNTYSNEATPVAGDIVYWHESYDNIDINYIDGIKMIDVINFDPELSVEISSTPRFITSYYNDQLVVSSNSTPNWVPPTWLPISRYEQYQAGFLGSTPYFISEYFNLKKDN